ncbi:hypothetical protein evm_005637 [Chilo suppressalis]|nr:hypothetical protein evm_005637 [Chilo suppressalis]
MKYLGSPGNLQEAVTNVKALGAFLTDGAGRSDSGNTSSSRKTGAIRTWSCGNARCKKKKILSTPQV